MKKKLCMRLTRLEADLQLPQNAILHFADGSTATIAGGDHPFELLGSLFRGEDVPADHYRELEMIRLSTQSEEPGGSLILELIHALQHSPSGGQAR